MRIKKRIRSEQKSFLLYGEGKTDATFLAWLRDLYGTGKKDVRFVIHAGNGGSPETLINDLLKKHLTMSAYDGCLVLLDEDVPVSDALRRRLEKAGCQLLLSEPCCLEGFLLHLLGDPKSKRLKDSRKLKAHFHRSYLQTDRKARIERRLKSACPGIFPESLLEKARKQNPLLVP